MSIAQAMNVRITAVALVFLTIICLIQIVNFGRNLIYRKAQLWCLPIFALPCVLSWLHWIVIYDVSTHKPIHFLLLLAKSLGALCVFKYAEKIMGWDFQDSKHFYNKKKIVPLILSIGRLQGIIVHSKCSIISTKEKAIRYLRFTKFTFYQFPIILLLLFVISIPIYLSDWHIEEYSIAVDICELLIATLAFTNMFILIRSLSIVPEMHGLNIQQKDIWIKLAILLTCTQPIIIYVFTISGLIDNSGDYSDREIAAYTTSLLTCYEMVIIGFLLFYVFPLSDYASTPEERRENYYNFDSSKLN